MTDRVHEADRWQEVERLFGEALDLAPADWGAHIDAIADEAIRKDVRSLLAHASPDGAFIEEAIGSVAGEWAGAADADADAAIVAGAPRRFGAYEAVAVLGQGGMGAVYRARRADGQFDQEVALKLIRSGFETPTAFERFRQERQILARLAHPAIARLLDGGATVDERGVSVPYLVMEHVDGIPITEYCDRHALGIPNRLAIFRRVCEAVQHAHQQLIVHRDLKPSNILVTAAGDPKLLDFGIAKLLTDDAHAETALTSTGMQWLTPDYASPEQVRGEPVTAASDVYALGALLYELLTGQKAHRFRSRSPVEISRVICDTQTTKPSLSVPSETPSAASLRRQLAGDLDTIIMRALRKEPQRRYLSVEQFSEDIRRYLVGLPVSARPDTFRYRSGKFLRRNRWAIAASAAVAASLIAGTIVSIGQARRAERRFEQVRQLATTLMYDVHDEIRPLPGSTKARQKIVSTALEYLHGLEADAADDPALEQDLAAAYLRVGDVQGGALESNLGQTEAALESYGKARVLFERGGGPARARSVADVETRIGDTLGYRADTAGALEAYARARAVLEPVADGPQASTADVRQLALVYQSQARMQGRLNQLEEGLESSTRALAAQRRLVEMEPDSREWRFRMGGSEAQVSAALHRLGRPAEALPHAQIALALREEEAAGEPDNVVGQRNLMLGYNHVAEILGSPTLPSLGDAEGALAMYRKMTAIGEKLVAADPKDRRARWDLANCFLRLGASLQAAGNPGEASERLIDGAAILEQLRREDAKDNRVRVALADVIVRRADLASSGARASDALGLYGDAIRHAEEALALDRNEASAEAVLANAFGGRGLLHAALKQRSAAVADGRRQLEIREQRSSAQPKAIPALLSLAQSQAVMARIHQALGTGADQADACRYFARSRELYLQAHAASAGVLNPAMRLEIESVERAASGCPTAH